jgi:hypothetical protein
MGRGKYDRVIDPQCFDTSLVNPATIGTVNLRNTCAGTQKALIEIDPKGKDVGYLSVADYEAQRNPVVGTLIFVNPKPGQIGTFRPYTFTGQGYWNLDANMGKTIEFMEGKRIEIRVDAMNILNHANPSASGGANGARNVTISNPSLSINTTSTTPFAQIATKAGKRTFQGRIRISF